MLFAEKVCSAFTASPILSSSVRQCDSKFSPFCILLTCKIFPFLCGSVHLVGKTNNNVLMRADVAPSVSIHLIAQVFPMHSFHTHKHTYSTSLARSLFRTHLIGKSDRLRQMVKMKYDSCLISSTHFTSHFGETHRWLVNFVAQFSSPLDKSTLNISKRHSMLSSPPGIHFFFSLLLTLFFYSVRFEHVWWISIVEIFAN